MESVRPTMTEFSTARIAILGSTAWKRTTRRGYECAGQLERFAPFERELFGVLANRHNREAILGGKTAEERGELVPPG